MAADGAALAEVRAGITFGVELYFPWDAPEAVVDISSGGVVPLSSSVVVRVQRKVVCFRAGTFVVCKSWFRIVVEWTKIFTLLPLLVGLGRWCLPRAGDTDMVGGHQRMPDLSLESPFDVHQDRPVSGWYAGLPVPHNVV